MANPVAQIIRLHFSPKAEDSTYAKESVLGLTQVQVYCRPCDQGHRFTVQVHNGYSSRADRGEQEPLWGWDGSLEKPTFTPSLRAYSTVHVCKGQHGYTLCPTERGEECEQRGHMVGYLLPDDSVVAPKTYEPVPEGAVKALVHTTPHTQDPAFGDCHTFLKDGVWQYLDDCAHDTRGHVPLEPLPDRFIREPWGG